MWSDAQTGVESVAVRFPVLVCRTAPFAFRSHGVSWTIDTPFIYLWYLRYNGSFFVFLYTNGIGDVQCRFPSRFLIDVGSHRVRPSSNTVVSSDLGCAQSHVTQIPQRLASARTDWH